MTHVSLRRRARLAGVFSLAELLAHTWSTREHSPSLPSTARLRRDGGLSDPKDRRAVQTPPG